jgi:hypothetical protein
MAQQKPKTLNLYEPNRTVLRNLSAGLEQVLLATMRDWQEAQGFPAILRGIAGQMIFERLQEAYLAAHQLHRSIEILTKR